MKTKIDMKASPSFNSNESILRHTSGLYIHTYGIYTYIDISALQGTHQSFIEQSAHIMIND